MRKAMPRSMVICTAGVPREGSSTFAWQNDLQKGALQAYASFLADVRNGVAKLLALPFRWLRRRHDMKQASADS
jgi:hypothetical protein